MKLETSISLTEMDGCEYKQKIAKVYQNGSYGVHVTHFWNFGTPWYLRHE